MRMGKPTSPDAADQYHLTGPGLVSAETCKAIGVNWNFDPCVDILFNWRNTIVNTRAYGDNPDDVLR